MGGRFVPPALAERYELELPEYTGDEQVVEVTAKVVEEEEEAAIGGEGSHEEQGQDSSRCQ